MSEDNKIETQFLKSKICKTCDKIISGKDFEEIKKHQDLGHEIIDDNRDAIQTLHDAVKNIKTKEPKIIKKVKGFVGDCFVESILVDSKPTFLCMHKPTGKLVLLDSIDAGDYIAKPLEPRECGYFPYSFTKDEIGRLMSTKLSKEDLLDEIELQTDNFISVREIDKHLILGDLFLSYCQDWVNTLHYPFFVGETESGKSSCLHLFKRIGYRCLYGEDIPNADIYNFLGTEEEGAGIIAEDEAQNLDDSREKIRTFKNSYSRGSVKARIITTNYSKKQVFYKTFCLKIFAGERAPQDKGFLERLAIVHMIEGETKGNIKRLTQQEELDLNQLRNKLLVWKVQSMITGLQKIDSDLKQRDQELWEDFLSAVHSTKYYDKCKNVVAVYTEQRHAVIRNSFEARILKLIINQFDKNLELSALNLWENITNNLPGRLDENKGTFYPDDYGKCTKNSLARLLQDKFQAIKRTKYEKDESKYHQKTFYTFKPEIIRALAKKYGIDITLDSPVYSGLSGSSDQTTQEPLDHLDNLDHYNEIQHHDAAD
ncbi:MAG: hypothetical protein HY222_06230 [Thaumarchaeota archaeon]|nr:hypothetical protein [Nitrososphaerota archaeon]MBI3641974.1 hypothetical protein [Nitrososphaerota archaeon]